MSYIGDKPSQTLASPTSQYFNGDGSTVAFTLNRPVNVSEDLEVFVNNIQQEPGVGKSYTATGTALTFDAAPSAGTANVYVVYRGLAEVTTRLEHDPNAALAATTGTFSGDLSVDTNTLYVDSANNRVGVGTVSPSVALDIEASSWAGIDVNGTTGGEIRLQKNGTTYGNIYASDSTAFVIDAASSNEIIFSDSGTERMRIDSSGRVTMPYQPVAYRINTHTANNWVTMTGSANNIFSNWYTPATNITSNGSATIADNGRFTATTAGIYLVSNSLYVSDSASAGDYGYLYIYKNGSAIGESMIANYGGSTNDSKYQLIMPLSLSVNDYVQIGVYAVGSSFQVYSPASSMFVYKIA